jgi:hypothetical protein
MLSTFWDWLKRQSLRNQTTNKIRADKTVPTPVAPGLADTAAWTPTTRTNGPAQKQIPYDTLKQLMQQLGPDDHMTVNNRGYFVTTKPGSLPRKDLPVDVFGSQQEDEEDGLAPS